MARNVSVDVDGVLAAAVGLAEVDELSERILDSASELFLAHGIRRTSVEDIAEHSGLGRTSIYRRFSGRQQVVEAVIARECRRFFTLLVLGAPGRGNLVDAVVESFAAGLGAPESKTLALLVRTEPELLQMFTVDAEPVITLATRLLVVEFASSDYELAGRGYGELDEAEQRRVALVAEALVRLAISLVLCGSPTLGMDDAAAGDDGDDRGAVDRDALRDLIAPMLAPLTPPT